MHTPRISQKKFGHPSSLHAWHGPATFRLSGSMCCTYFSQAAEKGLKRVSSITTQGCRLCRWLASGHSWTPATKIWPQPNLPEWSRIARRHIWSDVSLVWLIWGSGWFTLDNIWWLIVSGKCVSVSLFLSIAFSDWRGLLAFASLAGCCLSCRMAVVDHERARFYLISMRMGFVL